MEKAKNGEMPLLVTTEHRGVFFGYGKPTTDAEIVLVRARMCVYWSADMKGVMGLASIGPSKSCRIGPAVDRLHLRGVTSVAEVSKAAAKAWEGEPWNG